ncbi:hypothetical protein GCM10009827_037190 [Dactylosporangium maewongense]|uniref:Uncharacterized protein n=1 Tax=Dactylosporangium maewongense TaxID=634393 RepID=A0ABN2AHC1_9ACTN
MLRLAATAANTSLASVDTLTVVFAIVNTIAFPICMATWPLILGIQRFRGQLRSAVVEQGAVGDTLLPVPAGPFSIRGGLGTA